MNIQEYPVAERAVYQGVAAGVEILLKDVSSFRKPEVVIDTISYHVMQELCEVIDFGQQALNFSPALMRKMWQLAKDEEVNQPSPTPPTEPK